jgi:hypothetical protein
MAQLSQKLRNAGANRAFENANSKGSSAAKELFVADAHRQYAR